MSFYSSSLNPSDLGRQGLLCCRAGERGLELQRVAARALQEVLDEAVEPTTAISNAKRSKPLNLQASKFKTRSPEKTVAFLPIPV